MKWLTEAWKESLPLIQHPELRLRNLMTAHRERGFDHLNEVVKFWFNLQLHLHTFCNKVRVSYLDIYEICCRHAVTGYNHRELFLFTFSANFSRTYMAGQINAGLFHNLGLVNARDLECTYLGDQVDEVLGTLQCLIEGDTYCPYFCGCQAHMDHDESASEGS